MSNCNECGRLMQPGKEFIIKTPTMQATFCNGAHLFNFAKRNFSGEPRDHVGKIEHTTIDKDAQGNYVNDAEFEGMEAADDHNGMVMASAVTISSKHDKNSIMREEQ